MSVTEQTNYYREQMSKMGVNGYQVFDDKQMDTSLTLETMALNSQQLGHWLLYADSISLFLTQARLWDLIYIQSDKSACGIVAETIERLIDRHDFNPKLLGLSYPKAARSKNIGLKQLITQHSISEFVAFDHAAQKATLKPPLTHYSVEPKLKKEQILQFPTNMLTSVALFNRSNENANQANQAMYEQFNRIALAQGLPSIENSPSPHA